MIEKYGNIWQHVEDYDAIVITTNGFVKNNGEAVMGRGIALEATKRNPLVAQTLGNHLILNGNHVGILRYETPIWFSFPVKHHWKDKADIKLIERSTYELLDYIESNEYIKNILMPRPGCGNGRLSWNEVKFIIAPLLDDRFTVMEYEKSS